MSDLSTLVRMARLFWEESPYTNFTFSAVRVAEIIRGAIDDPNFVVFVTERESKITGMLIGQRTQPTFSYDWLSMEIAWYVEPEYRRGTDGIRLIKAFNKWQEEMGCKTMSLAMLSTSPKQVKDVYTHLGCSPVEIAYQKVN